jgi:hypothetical protein
VMTLILNTNCQYHMLEVLLFLSVCFLFYLMFNCYLSNIQLYIDGLDG